MKLSRFLYNHFWRSISLITSSPAETLGPLRMKKVGCKVDPSWLVHLIIICILGCTFWLSAITNCIFLSFLLTMTLNISSKSITRSFSVNNVVIELVVGGVGRRVFYVEYVVELSKHPVAVTLVDHIGYFSHVTLVEGTNWHIIVSSCYFVGWLLNQVKCHHFLLFAALWSLHIETLLVFKTATKLSKI